MPASNPKSVTGAERGLVNKHRETNLIFFCLHDECSQFAVQGRKCTEADSLGRRQPEGGARCGQLVA